MKKKSNKLPQLSEKLFMGRVIAGANALGYLVYHTHDSRRSTAGWPDLVLCHPKSHRLLIVEVKTDAGKVSVAQQMWLDALILAGVEALVLRPADWDTFWETLRDLAKWK